MKPKPATSVLNENINITQPAELANEILNDLQRSRGGDVEIEDVSRYQVTLRRADGKAPEWTGEVVGPPALLPLKTVHVLAAGTTLAVFDKSNKKLWEATLTHRVPETYELFDEVTASQGFTPCVERDGALYVVDAAVLTSFNLTTGSVNWRVPSVGIERLFFDDKGNLYVNTTTASPESLKYSGQIDITSDTRSMVIKLDPKSGKTLWAMRGYQISHLSGKYIYTLSMNQADDEADNAYATGLEIPSHVTIHRINPRNGRVMWRHYQPRCPLDVQFNGNTIELVFKKEVEVLKFLTL
jgi:outer membrane protein assembly factor BamB